MRRALVAALVALALPASAAAAEPAVVGSEQLSPRLTEYTLRTDALPAETKVRVLLPDGYEPARRYPVLYLLHGCCDDWRSWSDKGDVANITAGQPLIVVMPDGGKAGFYSDWYSGRFRYEAYHLGQLVPWVERTFATRTDRGGRGIAGLSMGGFGAMTYAARHPDRFAFAASFSGAVDNMDVAGLAEDALTLQDGARPGEVWGPRPTEEVRWRARNPVDLAENLAPVRLELRTGNGQPGGPYGGGDPIEESVHRQSVTLHELLVRLGKEHVWEDYGPGGHDWPYWQRDLRRSLPALMDAFAQPAPAPRRVTFTAVEPRYEVFGWRVELDRPVLEFSRLEDAGPRGFTLVGSGTAKVLTPEQHRPGRRYRVTLRGEDGTRRRVVRADRRGRLRLTVPLGDPNARQQYSPGATTAAHRTAVVLRIVTARRRG